MCKCAWINSKPATLLFGAAINADFSQDLVKLTLDVKNIQVEWLPNIQKILHQARFERFTYLEYHNKGPEEKYKKKL